MNIALVGAGGYGGAYIHFFQEGLLPGLTLNAVVEPFIEKAPAAEWIRAQQIPVYQTLDDLYNVMIPDLTILSTPIPLHVPQAVFCMEHGSHVLCEKPLTPSYEDALLLKQVSEKTGRKLGVGFQWSFSDTMLSLTKDIAAGILGRPLFFKTHISWVRPESYYADSNWKGRICNAAGDLVCDSILTNATAHYLHNILFLNGASMETAAMPTELHGFLGRVYPIETFDTCFVEGVLPNGCRFLHIASHGAEINSEPKLEYTFENATVYFDSNTDPTLYAVFKNGHRKEYGQPLSEREVSQKVSRMVEAITNDTLPCCSVDTILPHLVTCAKLLEQVPIHTYPVEQQCLQLRGGSWFTYARGLYEQMALHYENGTVPEDAVIVRL
ncbi:MAG: Gfo/Idh/MocA family oxidoreductase [Firmicutes bacterium]|nr:Gfo/Idh/MocA family oxidoreductase [Bacillota bacterium]